jgi:hypothetical protein
MYFIISTHNKPRFYRLDGKPAVEVKGITMTTKKLGMEFYPPIIEDSMQAISELYRENIPYFPTKKEARKEAVKMGLKGFKYLKL